MLTLYDQFTPWIFEDYFAMCDDISCGGSKFDYFSRHRGNLFYFFSWTMYLYYLLWPFVMFQPLRYNSADGYQTQIGLSDLFPFLFGFVFVQRPNMFVLLPLGLAGMRNFKTNWKKLREKMFTLPATLMSCRIWLMTFWLKLAVSELKLYPRTYNDVFFFAVFKPWC